MELTIGDYKIESDSQQFIVKSKRIIQESENEENIGKAAWTPKAYCVKIGEALRWIPQETLRTNDDINAIIEKLEQISVDIKALEELPVIEIKNNEEEKKPFKINDTLYHVINKNLIIEIKITQIEYNTHGIYVYGKNLEEENYRFIYKKYDGLKKTHFGIEVFITKEDAENYINKKEEIVNE